MLGEAMDLADPNNNTSKVEEDPTLAPEHPGLKQDPPSHESGTIVDTSSGGHPSSDGSDSDTTEVEGGNSAESLNEVGEETGAST